MGHHQAVKDVSFSNDGRKFLSCGYDRQMKLWDTETGKSVPGLFTAPSHVTPRCLFEGLL